MKTTDKEPQYADEGGQVEPTHVSWNPAEMTQAEFDALPRLNRAPVPYHCNPNVELSADNLKFVVDRSKTEVGVVVGGGDRCRLKGCGGARISVRWSDGTLTRPCTQDLFCAGLSGVMKIGLF